VERLLERADAVEFFEETVEDIELDLVAKLASEFDSSRDSSPAPSRDSSDRDSSPVSSLESGEASDER
jgi:hypothetical protein